MDIFMDQIYKEHISLLLPSTGQNLLNWSHMSASECWECCLAVNPGRSGDGLVMVTNSSSSMMLPVSQLSTQTIKTNLHCIELLCTCMCIYTQKCVYMDVCRFHFFRVFKYISESTCQYMYFGFLMNIQENNVIILLRETKVVVRKEAFFHVLHFSFWFNY